MKPSERILEIMNKLSQEKFKKAPLDLSDINFLGLRQISVIHYLDELHSAKEDKKS